MKKEEEKKEKYYHLLLKSCDYDGIIIEEKYNKEKVALDLEKKGYKIISEPEIRNTEDGRLYIFKCVEL